ncbi:MAG: hypothetical protein ACKOW3_01230, partial [Hyphomicrobium sp.]
MRKKTKSPKKSLLKKKTPKKLSKTKSLARPQNKNPFLQDWRAQFGLPPFATLKEDHYLPAFKKAFGEHRKEISAIGKKSSPPNFTNTLVALEKSGEL